MALVSVLIISAVILIITVSAALRSVSEAQVSISNIRKEQEISFLETCIDDALLRLQYDNAIPATITVPLGTCTVTSSSVGTTWTITVTGTQNGYTKSIQAVVVRAAPLTITSWKEQ